MISEAIEQKQHSPPSPQPKILNGMNLQDLKSFQSNVQKQQTKNMNDLMIIPLIPPAINMNLAKLELKKDVLTTEHLLNDTCSESSESSKSSIVNNDMSKF